MERGWGRPQHDTNHSHTVDTAQPGMIHSKAPTQSQTTQPITSHHHTIPHHTTPHYTRDSTPYHRGHAQHPHAAPTQGLGENEDAWHTGDEVCGTNWGVGGRRVTYPPKQTHPTFGRADERKEIRRFHSLHTGGAHGAVTCQFAPGTHHASSRITQHASHSTQIPQRTSHSPHPPHSTTQTPSEREGLPALPLTRAESRGRRACRAHRRAGWWPPEGARRFECGGARPPHSPPHEYR